MAVENASQSVAQSFSWRDYNSASCTQRNRSFPMIKDPYGRTVTSVRISVTQRCNLRCFYCHHEGEGSDEPIEMAPGEIQRIVGVAASFGVTKVKLTGGEPLLRSDILGIVRGIKIVPGISDVSMTTNGTLLSNLAKSLRETGLTRINVSLDTLEPETYRFITGTNALERVVPGIKDALKAGLSPVKVNMVVLKGVNDDQIWNMIDFAKKNDAILQLIELESAVEDDLYRRYHSDLAQIEKELKRKAEKIRVRRMHHRRKYLLPRGVEVEVVRPMHNTEFCKHCNRIRVTSNGRFKPCLFRSDNLVDFLDPMRNGASDEALRELFVEAVKRREPFFT
jgi:cyclic pyranopterin phosphate synthase